MHLVHSHPDHSDCKTSERCAESDLDKKSQGFLSSVFGSHSSFNRCIFNSGTEEEKKNRVDKNQSFFSSVLSTNHGLLTDLSSKIEAAFSLSLETLDSDSSSRSDEPSCKNSEIETDKHSSSSCPNDFRRASLPVAKTEHLTKHHRYTKRRGTKHKDRSVYGQPEIKPFALDIKQKSRKEPSRESLDTVDSGQQSNSSCVSTYTDSKPGKSDPFYVFRRTESTGIGSESDFCGQSTSLESSDAESIPDRRELSFTRCGSGSSLHSWTSSPSCDSQPDDITLEAMEFMKYFVKKIFSNSAAITFEEKAKFGELCQHEVGRLWFARCVNGQRVHCKQVAESTFYSLVQYFAIVLFECFEADDFSPAKSLMNMCFTFYHEVKCGQPRRQYLFCYLTEQPIWKSVRFWNAAFFDAVQCERANRQIPTRNELGHYSPEDFRDENSFQENIVFGQLGTFTYNMFAFGLSKEFCLEFLRKQCTIASLSKEHISLLKENIDRMFSDDVGKEYY